MKSVLAVRSRPDGCVSREDVLRALGLEERRSLLGIALPGIGLLCAGALAGAGLVLVFGPRLIADRVSVAEHEPAT